jgi:hypothetical protein
VLYISVFSMKVLDESHKKRPADGCCIWGFFLEGAQWSTLRVYTAASCCGVLTNDIL